MRRYFLVFKWMPRFGEGCWRPLGSGFFPDIFRTRRSAMATARRLAKDFPDDAIAIVRTDVLSGGVGELCERLPVPGGDVDYVDVFPVFDGRREVLERSVCPEAVL